MTNFITDQGQNSLRKRTIELTQEIKGFLILAFFYNKKKENLVKLRLADRDPRFTI